MPIGKKLSPSNLSTPNEKREMEKDSLLSYETYAFCRMGKHFFIGGISRPMKNIFASVPLWLCRSTLATT
jgi:hypothetical protein